MPSSENHVQIGDWSTLSLFRRTINVMHPERYIFAGFVRAFLLRRECIANERTSISCYISLLYHKTHMMKRQQPLSQEKQAHFSSGSTGKWREKLLVVFVLAGVIFSFWLFWFLNRDTTLRRELPLASMCDERARMLQDQFNVSKNHVHALAILVSTFHHETQPSAMDQKTFEDYTERISFERPLTSGVAYALRVRHSEREHIEHRTTDCRGRDFPPSSLLPGEGRDRDASEGKIVLPTNQSSERLLRIRHTCAHVMAMAVQKIYPDAKVTIGPWIEHGFYYDFDMEPLTDKDLKKIKKEMDEAGGGLGFWHPKGAILRHIIEDAWKNIHIRDGYDLLYTRHVARAVCWSPKFFLWFSLTKNIGISTLASQSVT